MVCSICNPGHSGGLSFEALTSVVPDAIIKCKLVISGERKVFCKKIDPSCLRHSARME